MKIFHYQSPQKNVAGPGMDRTHDLSITSRMRILLSHQGWPGAVQNQKEVVLPVFNCGADAQDMIEDCPRPHRRWLQVTNHLQVCHLRHCWYWNNTAILIVIIIIIVDVVVVVVVTVAVVVAVVLVVSSCSSSSSSSSSSITISIKIRMYVTASLETVTLPCVALHYIAFLTCLILLIIQ